MDPTLEQNNLDSNQEENVEHPGFLHLDPGMLENEEENIPIKSIYRKVEILSLDILKDKTRKLDQYQRQVVDIGIKYSKDVVKARNSTSSFNGPWGSRSRKIHSN